MVQSVGLVQIPEQFCGPRSTRREFGLSQQQQSRQFWIRCLGGKLRSGFGLRTGRQFLADPIHAAAALKRSDWHQQGGFEQLFAPRHTLPRARPTVKQSIALLNGQAVVCQRSAEERLGCFLLRVNRKQSGDGG